VTFEAIETGGLPAWLQRLRAELLGYSYCPTRLRRVEIPKPGGTVYAGARRSSVRSDAGQDRHYNMQDSNNGEI
jgi:hypothetical protein